MGFKGNIAGWDYDTAITRDKSEVKGGVVDGYFSQLGLARALNDPASTWNPWAPGGVQPAAVAAAVGAAAYIGPTAGGSFTKTGWDGRITNTVGKLAGGDVALSLGLDLRKEQFEVVVPAILESGDIAGLGGAIAPMSASRQVRSMFAEVNLPLLRNLEANVSARQDRYNDLAKDAQPITGKASVRWAPMSTVALRGSYGTGFRAPSLSELKTPVTAGTTEQFNDLIAGTNFQANSLVGGNPGLSPEESTQKSLGIVLTPRRNIALRADYFSIEVKKYITSATASALVAAARAGQTGFVTFLPDGSPNFVDERQINAGQAKFQGFDFGASWSDRFSIGQIGVDYTGTKMTKATLTTPDGTEDGLGKMVDSGGNTLKLIGNGGVILKYKHKLNFNWGMGPWGLTFTQNYTDGYQDGPDLNGNAHFVPTLSIYDIQGRYEMKFMKNNTLKLAVGVKNVFDKNPPLYISATNFFQYGFDPTLYDPLARLFYAKATLQF
jgi:iron complex outermembrane receptor protein